MRWRHFIFWLLALVCAMTQAAPMVELNPARQPLALGDAGQYWIDADAKLEPTQVISNPDIAWNTTPERGIYPLKPRQALWIKFTVPASQDSARWALEIPYPALDHASLYTVQPSGQLTEQKAGDLLAVNSWQTPHRHALMIVSFNPQQPTQYLLRLDNAQGFSAPVRFVNARFVLRSEQKMSLFLGFYFGMAALGLGVGLIGLVWLRDRAYLYYAVCSAMLGLTLAAITGAAALHLWPDSPYWADRSLAILGTWALLSVLLLSATVVSLAERSKLLNRLVWVVAGVGVILSILLGITDSALRLKLFVPYVVTVPVMLVGINLWAWRHGDRYGGWLLLTAIPFAIAWAIATARYLGWIPLSFITEQSGLASMAFQLPALLVVLVLRSQQSRENKRRILGLDRIDPATGLINAHVFGERLIRMVARSERLKHQSAVMLIDIINIEQIQRDFGRKVGDELPLRVASRLLSTAREIDSAARLSDLRFGMLVEGPISDEDAASLGPRIVARCLMPYKGLHDECVAQVRVAYSLVPHQGNGAQSLLSRLEGRLTAAASSDDKRAVFVL
jgi:two-component system, sensor histidine kinase LadS